MACYLPDHLVRCLICKNLFSDARRLRCGCVYCYLCCLKLVNHYTLYCRCSGIHQFNSQDEVEKVNFELFQFFFLINKNKSTQSERSSKR
jgi:hypothetical protein